MEILRRIFCKKIYYEYMEFKAAMLKKSKSEIYAEAYRIDIMINLYEILVEKAEKLPDWILWNLLQQPNILNLYYELWLKKEDSCYEELLQHVEEELRASEKQLAG